MEEILQHLLGPQALVVFILVILFAGWRGWWRWGRDYDRLEADRDEWKRAALKAISGAESAASIAENLVQQKKEGQ